MIFVAGETRCGARRGERERWEKERDEARRASSLGPEKLSEIMSEEIGSLARGWLTARSARAGSAFLPSHPLPPLPPAPSYPLEYHPGTVPIPEHFSRLSYLRSFRSSRSSSPAFPRFRPLVYPAQREKPRSFSRRLSLGTKIIPWLESITGDPERLSEAQRMFRRNKEAPSRWNCRRSHTMAEPPGRLLLLARPPGVPRRMSGK